MSNKTFLILGGYGEVGRVLARLILKETAVDLVIAGRNKNKTDETAAELRKEFPGRNISACAADACATDSLRTAFKDVQLVIAATTTPQCVKTIASAALEADCDYLDIMVSASTHTDLNELASAIVQKKKTFITQAGFHPGLPAVFIRAGAAYFDRYEKAVIAMAMNAKFERSEQVTELFPLLAEFDADICRNGSWRKATYRDMIRVDMGGKFGTKQLYPLRMEEIKIPGQEYQLKETGVYVSGFNWFIDMLVIPAIMLTQKIKRGLAQKMLAKIFVWGVNKYSSPYEGVTFVNDAAGIKDGQPLHVRIMAEHDSAYVFTAIPVVACLKQYLAGTLPTGLAMMGHVVDPKQMFDDMKKLCS